MTLHLCIIMLILSSQTNDIHHCMVSCRLHTHIYTHAYAGAQRMEDCACPADYYFSTSMPEGGDRCTYKRGTLTAPCAQCPRNSYTGNGSTYSCVQTTKQLAWKCGKYILHVYTCNCMKVYIVYIYTHVISWNVASIYCIDLCARLPCCSAHRCRWPYTVCTCPYLFMWIRVVHALTYLSTGRLSFNER